LTIYKFLFLNGELTDKISFIRLFSRFMNITSQLTDQAVLQELGERIHSARLAKNLTQAALAEQAGVAKRTVERLESGAAVQLMGFVRVCRALGVLERLEVLMPALGISPMMQLKMQGRQRQRAARAKAEPAATQAWAWGDAS
jgi:transcriptional regulator with XRE-family HTH domain